MTISDTLQFIINDLPGMVIDSVISFVVGIFTMIIHLPSWIQYTILGLFLFVAAIIALLVFKFKDEWRSVN